MDLYSNLKATTTKVLDASPTVSGPNKPDCFMQIAHIHRLKDLEYNYDEYQHNSQMQILRNQGGLHIPLKMGMELYAARQVGRLPCLESSHVMEDILLGRDDLIEFNDFLGPPAMGETMRTPQVVIEKALNIL